MTGPSETADPRPRSTTFSYVCARTRETDCRSKHPSDFRELRMGREKDPEIDQGR
jgi:hypothetical protein